jgi:acetylglutamate kinase
MAQPGYSVLKLGGELLEDAARLRQLAGVIAAAAAVQPLTIVHGGGREIDAALRRAGIEKRQVEGLRITDDETLDVVVEVLAGAVNTRVVAALCAAGARAVGLTGADAALVTVEPAAPHRTVDGASVDLGRVGQPAGHAVPQLLLDLSVAGYLPVVASLGATSDGTLLNVNADALAGYLAAALQAGRLIIAGGTAGVLDASGATIERLTAPDIDAMIATGVAHSGMVAKLAACRQALEAGVEDVAIVAGRSVDDYAAGAGTRLGTHAHAH